MKFLTKAIKSKAHYSKCNNYRWRLTRHFATGKGTVNFIMLNPSKANETHNDPTILRCENRAIEMGYKRMIITNIFAFKATKPQDLKKAKDPVGNLNQKHLLDSARLSDSIICAWGNDGKHLCQGQKVLNLLLKNDFKISVFKLNKSGEPAHPLYLPNTLSPKKLTTASKTEIQKNSPLKKHIKSKSNS